MMMPDFTRVVVFLLVIGAAGCGADDAPAQVDPAAFNLVVDPARAWYVPGQTVEIRAIPVGQGSSDGGSGTEAFWRVEPTSAVMQVVPGGAMSSLSLTLVAEGRLTVRACEDELGMTGCASRELLVDAGAPMLVVDAPLPGAAISDPEGIEVRGRVMDARMSTLYVNGASVAVSASGTFSHRLAPGFGVHHIEVVGSDGLTAEERVELDVLWAPSFDPGIATSGQPEHRLDDAIVVSLDRRFFDDGVPLERGADPIVTRDVADILELVLLNADLSSRIPSPLIDEGDDLRVTLSEVEVRGATADVALEDDGIRFFVRISEIAARTTGVLGLPGERLDLGGSLRLQASASAFVTVVKESPEAALEVGVPMLSVNIEDVEGSFSSEEVGALFRLADGALRSRVEAEVRDALDDELRAELAAIVRSTVRSLDRALAGGSFSVHAPPLPRVDLDYDARLRAVGITRGERVMAELYSMTGVQEDSIYPSTPGVPRVSTGSLNEVLLPDVGVQVGVRIGMMNGLLHALWASGGLRFDGTPLVPDGLRGLFDTVAVEGKIQPVLAPRRGGESGQLRMSIGQLELAFTSADGVARYGASLEAGLSLLIMGDRVSTTVDEVPTIRVWPIEEPDSRSLISAEVLSGLLRDQVWPELRAAVGESLNRRIPLPNLRELEDIAPAVSGTSFTFASAEIVAVRDGVIVVEGALLGEVP